MSTKAKGTGKSLALADILRDLAILRAFAIEFPDLLKVSVSPNGLAPTTPPSVASSVSASYDFIRYSRAALKLHHSGKVENEEIRLEQIRTKYEELLYGLQRTS